jgi:N-acetylglucosaminyldiphosphoundecaprenol N-acetyl-beta-D-mannosaminyltransferase
MGALKTEDVVGFSVVAEPLENCLEQIADWLDRKERPKFFACANPHSLVIATHDILFKKALLSADLLTPDGAGVVIASRTLGGTIRKRITGTDVFLGVCGLQNKSEGSVFFLGSTEKNLLKIRDKMALDYPNIRIVGSYCPPFRPEFSERENAAMIKAVNHAKPDALWVGMTAPKQEKWIHQNRNRLNVGFVGAIGAVFDFYSGNVKRPHPFFQRIGLEWLPRFLREPRRLLDRNLRSTPIFLWWILKEKFKRFRQQNDRF